MTPRELLGKLGIDCSEKSNRLQMLCPFHDDTNPSSGFYLDTSKFFCYTCSLSLDMTGFYARYKGISREEALRVVRGPKREHKDNMAIRRAQSRLNTKLKYAELDFTDFVKAAEQIDLVVFAYERGDLLRDRFQEVVEEMMKEEWKDGIVNRQSQLKEKGYMADPEFVDLT